MQETVEWFDDLLPVEQEKLKAVTKYKLVELEECLKREQVSVLRLKGLDKKREEILSGRGMPGYSFQQVMEKIPEEEQEELAPLYNKLTDRLREYRKLSENINEALQVGLHKFEVAGGSRIYNNVGTMEQEIKHFTSIKA